MGKSRRKATRRPTDAELEILRVLWQRGPSTVREVQEELGSGSGYTTVLKLLQIMTEKRLVKRDTRKQTHTYWAHRTEDETQRGLVKDLLDRAFGGSPERLVMQALTESRATAEEIDEIRKLLDALERKER